MNAEEFGPDKRELIEAIKRLQKALDLMLRCECVLKSDILHYVCGDCGKEFHDGMDFGVGGQFCNECMIEHYKKDKI